MQELVKKKIIYITCLCFIFVCNQVVFAQLSEDVTLDMDINAIDMAERGGFEAEVELPVMVAEIIKAFLGFMGLIFISLVIYGGFIWMTARGDESKVTHSKQIIQRATIGLLITVLAYSITYFVFNLMPWAGDTDVYTFG